MKNIFLILVLPILLFSYAIEFDKKFTAHVYPDKLSANIGTSFFNIDQNEVISKIDYLNSYIKNIKNIKVKNITFNVNPRYEYVNNSNEFKGYIGIVTYTVESDDTNKMNSFLNELIKTTNSKNLKDVILDIKNISWLVSDELKNKTIEKLRNDSINWINKNYSNKKCKVLKITIKNYDDNFINFARNDYSLNMSKASFDIEPIKEEKYIYVKPTYLLECK